MSDFELGQPLIHPRNNRMKALTIFAVLVGVTCGASLCTLYFSNRLLKRLDMQINSCVAIEGKLDMLLEATPQPEQK